MAGIEGSVRMTSKIDIQLVIWPGGPSQGFHPVKRVYEYRKAETLTDLPARLTSRQAVFYRNLIRLAEVLQSQTIPIQFLDVNGNHVAMDLGCVKIAEHAGFIENLTNGQNGYLESVRLPWRVSLSG
jgi:hypothetical protein